MSPRRLFVFLAFVLLGGTAAWSTVWPPALWAWLVFAPLTLLGTYDMLQTRHAIRRNFPVVGHGRYLLESVRPEINQYFVESNLSGRPFSREQRSVVYQRAKKVRDTVPFGTEHDVYAPGYEWMEHSIAAHHAPPPSRVEIGTKQCAQPYSASLLNVAAMSYGALSKAAIEALNLGAKAGGFFHNTGEGGISPYHRKGGDLVWQIGTGYFGCRSEEGGFSGERFAKVAAHLQVKMIEVKLSQGAKPGHGGILPAGKVTPEIAEIRGVPLGRDVLSPPAHTAFSTPRGLIQFLARLRELSGGKPVGFKLCLGHPHEFFAVCKAMVEEDSTPDFITVDGGEGGTGAAPLEFTNRVGRPLDEALVIVHDTLVAAGLRDRVTVIAAGRVVTGFYIVRRLALGADLCLSARAMMMALGCIQALRCNTNDCPTGVATQDPQLVTGLVVSDKAKRVANYQAETIEAFGELLGAAGFDRPSELTRHHLLRRQDDGSVMNFAQIHPPPSPGCLLRGETPKGFEGWARAHADRFEPAADYH